MVLGRTPVTLLRHQTIALFSMLNTNPITAFYFNAWCIGFYTLSEYLLWR